MDKLRKGIILAGGTGTRLYPVTLATCKSLLPIYDKPMVYYPLSLLMLAGIRQIAVISTVEDQDQYRRLLGDGSQWGVSLDFIQQESPDGLAQAYILSESFLDGSPSAMVLGDNLFFGHNLPNLLKQADKMQGATTFAYQVADPTQYGVVGFDQDDRPISIVEKPSAPESRYAICGIYFMDETASTRAKSLTPSKRGELEITSLLESYLHQGKMNVIKMGRGYAWLDVGTHGNLLDASNFVKTLSERQGLQIGSPDEIAYNSGWVTQDQLLLQAQRFSNCNYGNYLRQICDQ